MTRTIPHIPLWLKGLGNSSSPTSSNNITNAPDLPWAVIGDAENHLLQGLKELYWGGVKRELEVILLTLKKWQQPEYNSVVLDDEKDGFVHGFDTFIDQVSQQSRAFAKRYGMLNTISLIFNAYPAPSDRQVTLRMPQTSIQYHVIKLNRD
jgi:hypothetical protein